MKLIRPIAFCALKRRVSSSIRRDNSSCFWVVRWLVFQLWFPSSSCYRMRSFFSILALLLAAPPLWSNAVSAFSFRIPRCSIRTSSPSMVQHIPISPTTKQKMTSSSASSVNRGVINGAPPAVSSLNPITAALTKFGMMTFIGGMCLSLPLSLLVPWFLHKIGVLDRVQKEKASLRMGQRTARTLMTLIPFITVKVEGTRPALPEPSVWVCNHSSMLDVFVLLAKDHLLRGTHRRPIKIVYWKQLEDNVITKLLFRQCGFIPVQMADNGHGNSNDYDVSSFRFLLKETKRAFAEGFDIGILPEGQLNPTPERGLLPIYSGAYTLAKMAAKRPIHMMAHYNIHQVWHPTTRGMMLVNPTCRNVKIRVYPSAHYFESANEFTATFRKVVGEYATYGRDLPNDELEAWTDGSAWKQHKSQMESSSQQQPSVD